MILMASGPNRFQLSISDARRHATDNYRFEFVREVGRGAFGVVYKATDCKNSTVVAIKVISTTSQDLSLGKAEKEARTLSRLRNPYVIGFIYCYKFTFPRGQGFSIVTRYCSDGSLGNYLLKYRPDRAKRLQWCRQLSLGIQYIHEQGIVHRDLKPDNILIDDDDALKIADVGVAKAVWEISESSQKSHDSSFDQYMATIEGTLPFMAPEVFNRHYLCECDIFSLGLVFLCIIEAPHSSAVAILARWNKKTFFLGELYHKIPVSRNNAACSLMTLKHATHCECQSEIRLINEMCHHDYNDRCGIDHVVRTLNTIDKARKLPVVRLRDPKPSSSSCCF